jgi:hypothetical protein
MFGEEYKLWSSSLCSFLQSPVSLHPSSGSASLSVTKLGWTNASLLLSHFSTKYLETHFNYNTRLNPPSHNWTALAPNMTIYRLVIFEMHLHGFFLAPSGSWKNPIVQEYDMLVPCRRSSTNAHMAWLSSLLFQEANSEAYTRSSAALSWHFKGPVRRIQVKHQRE